MASILDPFLSLKVLFLLGITNLLLLFLVFMSCRCLIGKSVFNTLMKHEWYKKFFNFHCLLWWLFFISVFLHAVLAIMLFGIPLS